MRPFAVLLAAVLGSPVWAAVSVTNLRCEYFRNPVGIDASKPRLSWMMESAERGRRQAAYRVLVASTGEKLAAGEADLWDSGKVASDRSIQVEYAGKPLSSRQRCHWKVQVWDQDGRESTASEPAFWEMGLLSPSDWRGEWIGYPGAWPGRALYFRNEITVKKPVRTARAYIAGLGYYELRVNGTRVGDSVLDPGWTDFSRRVLYATYDITPLLRSGRNAVGVILGNGWYGMPKLLMQVEVTHQDGTVETLATTGGHANPTWRVTSGPVTANSIYDGEIYDARLEKPGWDLPGTGMVKPVSRSEGWATVFPVEPPGGRLMAQMLEPIKVIETLQPKRVSEPKPGVFVFDTGQNLAGWAQLSVSGARGTEVTLRFAETLYEDGTVNQENLRKAAATDVYICKGEGREVWEPRFTYHGFRYVQVEGFPGKPTPETIRIRVVRSSVEPNGVFESSNELLNRIYKMVWWTEASNLHSVPTDCPQRDERQGWMNDLTVRLEEAIYNFRLPSLAAKFLNDVTDTQGPDGAITDTVPFRWGFRPADAVSASYLLLGWLPYQHYGDTRSMAAHYEGFKGWTGYMLSRSKGGIMQYGYYGDWCPPKEFGSAGHADTGSSISKNTPNRLMSTGYLYYCSRLVSQMAEVLGKKEDQAKYAEQARMVAQAFNREYWDERAGGYGTNNQAANSFALFLGVVPKERQERVVASLVKDVRAHGNHLTTGNLCTKYLLEMLSEHGHADVAFDIATQTTYPGWGFMLENGATTLWERWEYMTGGQMNSHNHPMMGSVASWMYKHLGGIAVDPLGPGFKRILLRPHAARGLDWVRAEYTSPYGLIRSAWKREPGGFAYRVTVPPNSTAEVHLPAGDLKQVTEGGKAAASAEGVRFVKAEGGRVVLEVGSGSYEFLVRASP